MSTDLQTERSITVDAKQQFLDAYARECAITRKLLHAFPAAEGEFRPHPRSMNARQLAFMFAAEAGAGMAVLNDTFRPDGRIPDAPPTMADIIGAFEQASQALTSAVSATPAAALHDTSNVPVGKGVTADVPKLDFLWLMLNDQIHHRGQLSVYTRMAGGKVPSMYGPSADEPWI
jgi:uncharacterized damage-inducible protein DinB